MQGGVPHKCSPIEILKNLAPVVKDPNRRHFVASWFVHTVGSRSCGLSHLSFPIADKNNSYVHPVISVVVFFARHRLQIAPKSRFWSSVCSTSSYCLFVGIIINFKCNHWLTHQAISSVVTALQGSYYGSVRTLQHWLLSRNLVPNVANILQPTPRPGPGPRRAPPSASVPGWQG